MPRDNDFDFDANEDTLSGESSVNDDESGAVDNDEDYLEDDEAYMGEEDDVMLEDFDDTEPFEHGDEDEEEEVAPKEEETVVPEPKKEDESGDPYSKIREDILGIVGEDTILKIKNRELRAGDLTKEELVMHLQKGIRADDLFQEAAVTRRQLEQERALVTKGAQAVEILLREQEGKATQPMDASKQKVLDQLKVGEYDTENEKTLKIFAAELVKEVDALKKDVQQGKLINYESEVVNEIKALKKQYPLASVDEVLAVKTSHPDASLERLMEAGHNYYTSLEFINEALSNNPQAKREYDESVIRNYNAKKGKAKNVPLKRSRTSGSEKVSTKSRPKMGFEYGFDNAADLGRDYLREVAKSR